MSTAVFPSLPGLAWSVDKQPEFSTVVRASASGQETRVALWPNPRWHFKLGYELLRADAHQELQTLMGFFLARQGQYDSFLYQDPDDNAVAAQPIGAGDGATALFQLYRSFGGFAEPVRAPNLGATLNVYLAGVLQSPGGYTVSGWGTAAPGQLSFAAAPGAGVAITADFSFYYPVRFAADLAEFSEFMHQLWELRQIELVSVFN
jgi:uncharacterized protein (TIGR02217 family)